MRHGDQRLAQGWRPKGGGEAASRKIAGQIDEAHGWWRLSDRAEGGVISG
jgi:hypothetical protein